MNNPSSVIKFDKTSGKLQPPTLLLKTRTGNVIGKINNYENLQLSFVGKGLDEISFDVHKIANGIEWENWDRLQDLSVIDYVGYGQFEADVSITDENETIKTVCCVSLEAELGQLIIREGHYNDEVDIAKDNYKPTVLYNPDDTEHSLLHRVLKDKAPHWSIGYVSPLFNINSRIQKADKLQRTFTVDGTAIYDFLEGEISEEFCCVFVYDTYQRKINCYNLDECVYDTRSFNEKTQTYNAFDGYYCINGIYYTPNHEIISEDNELYGYLGLCDGIGEDTNIFLTKNKLSQSFSVDSDKDSIKNCFYVTGGDEIINNYIGAANVTGNNYIYIFPNFQYEDMGEELTTAIQKYSDKLTKANEDFVGENGLFTKYLKKLDEVNYLEHSKFPNTSLKDTTATEQLQNIEDYFKDNNVIIQFSCTNESFSHVTGNIESMLQVVTDVRYKTEIISDVDHETTCDNIDELNTIGTWSGHIKITREIDEKDTISSPLSITVKLVETDIENEEYCKQKMEIAIANSDVYVFDIDNFNFANITDQDEYENKVDELKTLLRQYNVKSLESFYKGFELCMSTLTDLYNNLEIKEEDILVSDSSKTVRQNYVVMRDIAKEIYEEELAKLTVLKGELTSIENEIEEFRKDFNLQSNLGDELYKQFRCYVREDEYNNSNYISDGLTDTEILNRCQELLEIANGELSKACNIQNVISGDINDIFALNELSELHDKFALYNYVRVRVDDKIYKLRLMEIGFSDQSIDKLDVTFSDQVVSVDGKTDDTKNILKQAQSIATTYKSTMKQAQQGSDALGTVSGFRQEGLDSSLYLIKTSNSEVITIDKKGINCKSEIDSGIYSNCQSQHNSNGLYFTKDNWATVETALGKFKYNGKWTYGLNAETIVGQLIVGEELDIIGDINVGNDLKISGIIQSKNYKKGKLGSMLNLSNGVFDFAGGKLTYDEKNGLQINGNGTFKGTIYANDGEFNGVLNVNECVDMNGNQNYNFSVDSNGVLYSRSEDSELTIYNGRIESISNSGSLIGYYAGFGTDSDTAYGHVSISVGALDARVYDAQGINPEGGYYYTNYGYHIGTDGIYGNEGGARYELSIWDCKCNGNDYSFSDIYSKYNTLDTNLSEVSLVANNAQLTANSAISDASIAQTVANDANTNANQSIQNINTIKNSCTAIRDEFPTRFTNAWNNIDAATDFSSLKTACRSLARVCIEFQESVGSLIS